MASTIKLNAKIPDTKGRYVANIEGVEGEGELHFRKYLKIDHRGSHPRAGQHAGQAK